MIWDFFFRTENKNFDSYWMNRPANQIRLDLPVDTSLEDAIGFAHKAGVPMGSARSGIFEVQNDLGIFAHINNRSIDHAPDNKTEFKTWELIERENEC